MDLITIVGPTATGKTSLAANLAYKIDGEIISADSRQVYRDMNIGTGKDYYDYVIKEKQIPCHLIDIVEAGYEYNVYEYQKDFLKVFNDIKQRKKQAVLCGGTGLYVEAVLKGYKLLRVPPNQKLREKLSEKSQHELIERLSNFKNLHNKTDTENRKRLERAIEIETYYDEHKEHSDYPQINTKIFATKVERDELRKKITTRLKQRLDEGMIDEVKTLINKGIKADKLKYYGLEYKFITQFVLGEINYNDMFQRLNSSIHQFSKRQMTWFRKMQRDGFEITWIDVNLPMDEKIEIIINDCQ